MEGRQAGARQRKAEKRREQRRRAVALRRHPRIKPWYAALMMLRRTWLLRTLSWCRRLLRDLVFRNFRAASTLSRLGKFAVDAPRPLRVTVRPAATPLPADPPSISIVVASRNRGPFLGRTLASIFDQQYPAVQVIIAERGSTDTTATVLEPWRDRVEVCALDPEARAATAINRGMARATGEILACLSAEDVLLPGSLAYVGAFFAAHRDVDVIYGHRVVIDVEDREINRWILPTHRDETLRWFSYVPPETTFWRRAVWERVGGDMNEEYDAAMDWELLLRFLDAGAKIVRVPRFIGALRSYPARWLGGGSGGRTEVEMLRMRSVGVVSSKQHLQRRMRAYLWRHVGLDRAWRLARFLTFFTQT